MGGSETFRSRDADGVIVAVRWLGVLFAIVQTATFYRPFPGHVELAAWVINALFGLSAVALTAWYLRARRRGVPPSPRFGLVSLVIDVAAASAMTWTYAFDPDTAIFAVTYLAAVEGAFRYGMRGAMLSMGALTALYVGREAWAASTWDIELLPASISFRMGLGFLIAAMAGGMAERYSREHRRLGAALERERQATAALRSVDDLRSTFLSAVSHELRTPLTSILGFSLTLQDRSDLPEPARAMLEHVVGESRTLERLLQDLLDIERMGRGSVTIHRRATDVAALAAGAARTAERRTERRIELDTTGAMGVVDAAKVERIIDNLLGNALKYTADHSTVLLHVERSGDGVLVSVDDEGPGVPEALRGRIFEPFERGALMSSHQPGTGIGLSLVDRFARLHGGRAWVQDREHASGASFRVYLPDGPEGEQSVHVVDEPWGEGGSPD